MLKKKIENIKKCLRDKDFANEIVYKNNDEYCNEGYLIHEANYKILGVAIYKSRPHAIVKNKFNRVESINIQGAKVDDNIYDLQGCELNYRRYDACYPAIQIEIKEGY